MKFIPTTLLFFFFLISISSIRAQDKMLGIDELMSRKLFPRSLANLQWRDNHSFSWTANNSLLVQAVGKEKPDTVLTLDKLIKSLDGLISGDISAFPQVQWNTSSSFSFNGIGKWLAFDLISAKASLINSYDPEGENEDLEPLTGRIAYTKANNLFVSIHGETLAVTTDSDVNIVNGQSVHRNEFGIDKGTFWSPKGNFLAFYRMDQTMVADYPLVNINERIARVENMKYPMAGMASHHVTVGVFDPVRKAVVFLKTGEPAEQYLTNISWSPDEKYIYIAVLNRGQDHMWLNKYDALTGEFVKTLFEETDKEYVEPTHELVFLKTDPGKFIWQSRRDGWNHLYLYDTEGNLLKQLTKGNWEVTELEGLDSKESRVFFISTESGPLQRHLYSVDMKSGKMMKLSADNGTHSVFLSPDGKYYIDKFSNLSLGCRYNLNSADGKQHQLVFEDENPLKNYKLGETSLLSLRASDSSDLFCRMIKPAGFDPAKKYPVLIYVYGGPHSQMVTNTWLAGAGLFLNYMAEKGYLIFTLDNRGTANRGADFEQCIHRKLGQYEVEDQMKGVEYLKSLPYVDSTRIGVDGWSYGGFLVLNLKLRYPGVFKVASCGGPVVDWKYYEVMYGERYMDTPEQNPVGYKNACMVNYVDNLKGKLIVIHDAQDKTVVWQNSLQFIQQCVLSGKQVDYFIYPNHEHNVTGKDRLHLFRKLADYYGQNL